MSCTWTAQGQIICKGVSEHFYAAPPKMCGELDTKNDCSTNNRECKWENNDCVPKCKAFMKPKCNLYNAKCDWNDDKKMCDFASKPAASKLCGDLNNQKDCSNNKDCRWANQLCIAKCNAFNRDKCSIYKACIWNGKECDPNCTQLEKKERCQSYTECAWNNKDGCNLKKKPQQGIKK